MAGAGKARKRDTAKEPEWRESKGKLVRRGAIEPIEDESDAIGQLLGEPATLPKRRRFNIGWAQVRWALLIVVVIGVASPVFLWMQYQSTYVTSKNAAVRGHLAEIGSRLTGLVSTVEVDVGDRVVAGQVLVQLENRHLEAEVQEARADVAGLERKIEVERLSIDHERRQMGQQEVEAHAKVNAAEAQVEAARIDVDDAERDYALRESLYSRDGAISSEDVHEAESARRSAQARLQEAEANRAAAQSQEHKVSLTDEALDIRLRNLGVLEADLLRAQARLARAEADLEGAAIRAPEDGAIVRRIIQPGGSVEVGQPIISMWLGDKVWVDAWVDEQDIGQVRLGSRATVTLHSFPGQEFVGVVDKIGLATDLELPDTEVPQPRSRRMRGAPVVGVRISLDDPPADLLPGLSAVVAIEKAE